MLYKKLNFHKQPRYKSIKFLITLTNLISNSIVKSK